MKYSGYVQAIHERLIVDARVLQSLGFGVVGINPNDARQVPADAPERMAEMVEFWGLNFPYLHDPSQPLARACGAICTPDFFAYDAGLRLVYHGRLDGAGRAEREPGQAAELVEAMQLVARGRPIERVQLPSVGCSIKWKR